MSKTAQILQIARDELNKTEGETVPKADLLATIDDLIKALPRAQAMDEQQLDIFITYMRGMHSKMDLLFNATVLCGIGLSNDLKTRATIKQMGDQMTAVQNKLDHDLLAIVDPEAAKEQDEKNRQVQEAAAKAMPGQPKK